MSSRVGPRAVGSDGSDFLHREKVASHYKNSAVFKWRFKFVLIMHLFLVFVMLMRLSTSLCVMAKVRPPAFLQKLRLPRPELWEYVWLASTLATILGFFALPKNRYFVLKQSIIGQILFGIGPVLYAMYTMTDELFEYWETRETKNLFMGFPRVVLWNMFLVIALQVHIFGITFAWQLLKAWGHRGNKKKAA